MLSVYLILYCHGCLVLLVGNWAIFLLYRSNIIQNIVRENQVFLVKNLLRMQENRKQVTFFRNATDQVLNQRFGFTETSF